MTSSPTRRRLADLYGFADIEMDLDEVRKRFQGYQDHFGIPTEPV